jgi:hypothetical protein
LAGCCDGRIPRGDAISLDLPGKLECAEIPVDYPLWFWAGQQNWPWVDQSIIAVTHRLTRPINHNQDDRQFPNDLQAWGTISRLLPR